MLMLLLLRQTEGRATDALKLWNPLRSRGHLSCWRPGRSEPYGSTIVPPSPVSPLTTRPLLQSETLSSSSSSEPSPSTSAAPSSSASNTPASTPSPTPSKSAAGCTNAGALGTTGVSLNVGTCQLQAAGWSQCYDSWYGQGGVTATGSFPGERMCNHASAGKLNFGYRCGTTFLNNGIGTDGARWHRVWSTKN